MRAFAHDVYTYPLPEGHRFPLAKYRMVREEAERLGALDVHDADAAQWDDLRRTHSDDWVERVRRGGLERREQLALGLPWSAELVERARRATGATVLAARAALADGIAANLGGVRAVPHYNVMGVAKATLDASMRYLAWDLGQKQIRVNAISAGPVRTLAARSIAGFTTMEEMFEQRAPLHRHNDAGDCGAAAAYLLSDDARNVSGTMLYVDAGYHAMGM